MPRPGRATAAPSLHRLGVRTLARLLETGEARAEDIVRACLERIAERDPAVQAWACVDPALALRAARALDRSARRGPLHGIPVGVKDVIDTADLPTAYGSPIYQGYRPGVDAASVAAVRAAGAVVLGKTVTAEFAHRLPGPTTHPLDPLRTPGGSSSGSAAAVADFMAPLALGTQTTASTIRPASYCGVVGYRPTYGLVSCAGVKPSSASFDTLGAFARSVDDCALLRDALMELPPRPPAAPDAPPRIGFCRTPFWSRVEPAAAARLEAAAAHLAGCGARADRIELGPAFADVPAAHRTISSYELARNLASERRLHREGLSAVLREGKMAEGLRTGPAAYAQAQATLEAARLACADLLREVDVLLAPAAPGVAPVGLNSTGSPEFCTVWTALHLPALALPLPCGAGELPLGVQILGRRGEDAQLFDAAAWVEARLARLHG